mmetsp:Transcript_9086/g.16952  ORF Transcript_9086/g.16952 Transcript_9086/m.16952 type:complete len:386 (-) Transcript_9086:152-1309(-)
MINVSHLIDIIFDENATASELLTLVAAIAVFWAAFFYLFGLILRPMVYGKPWLIAAGERDYERGGKELYEQLGIAKTKDEFVDTFMDLWPWNQAVYVQHFVGGMLCVPAIFGLADEGTASSLACLGILSEMGWEIEDMATWLYKRFCHPDGKVKVPNELLILLIIHHSMTTLLGMPMVLHYRNLRTLHWLCFDLQIAGAVALSVQEYTKLLEITERRQLFQFQLLTSFALVVMIVTRGLHWVYLCADLISMWYHEKAWVFLGVGSVISLLFSFFNWFFCIEPFYKRFAKFVKVSAEYKKLPADADSKKRRSSVVVLEAAAAEVLGRQQVEEEILSLFAERKVKRRGTMPPSMFGSKGRRRASVVLLRSSVGNISNALSRLDYKED